MGILKTSKPQNLTTSYGYCDYRRNLVLSPNPLSRVLLENQGASIGRSDYGFYNFVKLFVEDENKQSGFNKVIRKIHPGEIGSAVLAEGKKFHGA